MNIGLLAGEASGDILGAALIRALREQCPDLRVEGIGGPLMQAQGLQSLFPMERLSVMGLVEPLQRLPELLHIRKTVFEHFRDKPPDVFVGIDSPDFNLHLEQKLRACGVKTAHLVSPSVWAWRQGRIKKIKRAVDLMLTLFPFEAAFYRQHEVPVCFVGHPLADEIPLNVSVSAARETLGVAPDAKVLALLPGSRSAEVALLAPLFFDVAKVLLATNPELQLLLPAANAARRAQIQALLPDDLPVTVIDGQSRTVMSAADAVLLASGTATLEALLLKKPMVIAYKMGALSWLIISRMVRSPFAGLPNILADKALVPECLQGEANTDNIVAQLNPLLNGQGADVQREAFNDIHLRLRQNAGQRAATALIDLVNSGA
ncbi:MAG: lipid-A-disaccharide synthase [Gammaproteobacteria bacterium]|nr:MAG: lipid-A-disaccharide synthase [Gammaproteobacteria bacterium]